MKVYTMETLGGNTTKVYTMEDKQNMLDGGWTLALETEVPAIDVLNQINNDIVQVQLPVLIYILVQNAIEA